MSLSIKTFYALALAYLFTAVSGASVPELGKRGDGFLQLDFSVARTLKPLVNATETPGLSKRGAITAPLQNKVVQYLVDIVIGSDQQLNTVSIDTGSSDLWVVNPKYNGTFNPATSKTFKDLGSYFFVHYADGSGANGTFATDNVALSYGGPAINVQFGYANISDAGPGILGIGYPALEGPVYFGYGKQYVNYPEALAKNGLINKNAYSLYLNSLNAESGTLLFGGIDNAKYQGHLIPLPSTGPSDRLDVQLTSITYDGTKIPINQPGNLDSGTTITYLPNEAVHSLAEELFGSQWIYDSYYEYYYATGKCPDITKDLSFDFNGVSIKVPPNEFIAYYADTNQCQLNISPSGGDSALLGDTFLRHAYVVYNLEDRIISLAQVKFTDESNISVIN